MLLSREDRAETMVLTPQRARIDAAVAGQIGDEAKELLSRRPGDCVMDLGRVTFLDSMGLGMLVTLLKTMGPQRRLTLASLNPAVKKTLRLTRMDTVFATSDTVDNAIARTGHRASTGRIAAGRRSPA